MDMFCIACFDENSCDVSSKISTVALKTFFAFARMTLSNRKED